jgi:hypothetical protein
MTISKKHRDEDFDKALLLMMAELADGNFGDLFVDGDDARYANVLDTTWWKLFRCGLVKDDGLKRFRLTAEGWYHGVEISGWLEDEKFRAKMSQLSATFKGYIKGRTADALVGINQIAGDSRLSVAFIRNVIASKLLDREFHLIGVTFGPGDDMESTVLIPLDYGQE